jgi:hypothetical protein
MHADIGSHCLTAMQLWQVFAAVFIYQRLHQCVLSCRCLSSVFAGHHVRCVDNGAGSSVCFGCDHCHI